MSEQTRAALLAALAAHLELQADAVASGQDPASVDRRPAEKASRAHLAASAGKDELQAAFETARDARYADPGSPGVRQAESDAAEALASAVMAQRVLDGLPIASHVGG